MARSLMPFSRNMPIARWGEDWDPFASFRREMNRLFEDAFRDFGSPSAFSGFRQMQAPKIDVSETDKEFKVCAELPGVNEDDVEVLLDDDRLIIRGEMKEEREDSDKDRNYHMRERMQGAFSRVLPLHFRADPGKVHASFRNGVLTITMPKPEEEQQRQRRIQIQKEGRRAEPQTSRAGSPAQSPTGQPAAQEKEKETAGR